jgi:hypothetical protein
MTQSTMYHVFPSAKQLREYIRTTHAEILSPCVGKTVNFIPEEIHVLGTKLATYVSSDVTTTKVTNQ